MLDRLEALYGPPPASTVTDPLEQILWENVAYLVSDAQRGVAFEALRTRVGLTPDAILSAPPGLLGEVAALGGILPENRVGKLTAIAAIARKIGGDLRRVVRKPLKEAKKALMQFPGIGDPGAEKILLLAGAHPVLALDSNALRVLVRLGFGTEKKGYQATYRSAQEAIGPQLKKSSAWLVRAHKLLRHHGQETCKASHPHCEVCPLQASCDYYRANR